MALTSKQRAKLRALANTTETIIQIGKGGITDAVVTQAEQAIADTETKIAELSTGMKQKTAIAVSLVHDPDFIVFDEPTNGLDVLTAKSVTDFLLEQKARGKTVLLSTHIFSLVEKICDRVGIIIDGKMAAEGNVKELCGGRSLEDAFFDIYAATKGDRAV